MLRVAYLMNLMRVSLSIRNIANELKASIILFFTDLFYGFGFVFYASLSAMAPYPLQFNLSLHHSLWFYVDAVSKALKSR